MPNASSRPASANPTLNLLFKFTMLMFPTTGAYETYKQRCDSDPHSTLCRSSASLPDRTTFSFYIPRPPRH